MDSYKNHPFYTHQPFLIEILKKTTGNVLECGCGDGSTKVIKEHLKGGKLYSLESNLEWLNKFTHLESDSHKLYHVPASNEDTPETGKVWVDFIKNTIGEIPFEVVFIDSSPWLSRKYVFDYFK